MSELISWIYKFNALDYVDTLAEDDSVDVSTFLNTPELKNEGLWYDNRSIRDNGYIGELIVSADTRKGIPLSKIDAYKVMFNILDNDFKTWLQKRKELIEFNNQKIINKLIYSLERQRLNDVENKISIIASRKVECQNCINELKNRW